MSGEVIIFITWNTANCSLLTRCCPTVRQVLEYKSIPYHSEFLELPQIASFCEARGIPPNEGPDKPYTVPILRFPSGQYVMNSLNIIDAIEEYQPLPALKKGDYDRVRAILKRLMEPLFCLFATPALKLFHPESRAHWVKSVSPPNESLETWLSEQDHTAVWTHAESAIEELRQLLEEHSGPYINGVQPSYADMVLAASWKVDEAVCPDVLVELKKRIPKVTAHFEACKHLHGKPN